MTFKSNDMPSTECNTSPAEEPSGTTSKIRLASFPPPEQFEPQMATQERKASPAPNVQGPVTEVW